MIKMSQWRYVEMATRFLHALLRRDVPTSPDVAKFFMELTISPQPTIRVYAQRSVSNASTIFITCINYYFSRAVVKLATFVKIRTYAKSDEELWLDEWANPLQGKLVVTPEVIRDLQRPSEDDEKWVTAGASLVLPLNFLI
jgi:proteasome activator subunit 4